MFLRTNFALIKRTTVNSPSCPAKGIDLYLSVESYFCSFLFAT